MWNKASLAKSVGEMLNKQSGFLLQDLSEPFTETPYEQDRAITFPKPQAHKTLVHGPLQATF